MTRDTQRPDPGPLLALNFGFARARVLGTAVELGVFTELAGGPRPAGTLASALGCDTVALTRLLDALADLGLVTGDDDSGRRLTALAEEYLVPGRPGHLGEHFTEVLEQWDNWGRLTDAVRTGVRGNRLGPPRERDLHPGMFAGAHPLAAPMAEAVVAELGLRPAGRVLDYTAGSGEWGIALAADPAAEVTAHDTPGLLAVARRHAVQAGVADRFAFVPGDFGPRQPFADGSFDTVVMAHAGRFAGPEETARMIAACARMLRDGGTFVYADIMRADPGGPPLPRAMLDLSLLVNTRHGGLRDPADCRTAMEQSGLLPKQTVTRGLVTALTGQRR
ncbi:class I SAM-dependent methyltransferase [Streptomyces sp. NPDC049597]|uniref:class I SAM-dependent methyltransferase n=1 Tax=Streptomyces sp. NPDC049597 TaxID=3155276 RepID=UPI00341D354E